MVGLTGIEPMESRERPLTVGETRLAGGRRKLCPRLCPTRCLPSTNTVTYRETRRKTSQEGSRETTAKNVIGTCPRFRSAFQACAFIRLRSHVNSARATARWLAVAGTPRRRTTTRPSLRFRINELRAVWIRIAQNPPSRMSDLTCRVLPIACGDVPDVGEAEICQTSQ